jgi:hypothetical protein
MSRAEGFMQMHICKCCQKHMPTNLKFDSHRNNANYANFILHIHAVNLDS